MIALAYLILFADKLKAGFIKHYPAIAIVSSIFIAFGVVVGAVEFNKPINFTRLFVIAWVVTALSAVWLIITRKDKNNGK